MHEIVVISGKGGTGKTSVTAALALLAESAVVADADVDSADLHLLLQPQVEATHAFRSGHHAVVRGEACIACGACLAHCRFEAVRRTGKGAGEGTFFIDPLACEGCGVCVHFCPVHAIDFPERFCGWWYVSEARSGPMVHARLDVAAENSGRLVSTVRQAARDLATARQRDLVLIDGPPGVGCAVIASVTGCDLVLVVTEPTRAGEHDLERALALAEHFRIPAAVCINKWDMNPPLAGAIERACGQRQVPVVGRIGYDSAFWKAQLAGQAVVEQAGPAADSMRALWANIQEVAKPYGVMFR